MEKENKQKKRPTGDNAILDKKEILKPTAIVKAEDPIKIENSGGTAIPQSHKDGSAEKKSRKALLPPWFVIDR